MILFLSAIIQAINIAFLLVIINVTSPPVLAVSIWITVKKCDKDRLIVEYKLQNGTVKKSSLSHWMKLKLNISSIIEVSNINNYCRFCNSSFSGSSAHKCKECGKARVWFKISVYNKSKREKEIIEIKDLPKLNGEIRLRKILRQREPI